MKLLYENLIVTYFGAESLFMVFSWDPVKPDLERRDDDDDDDHDGVLLMGPDLVR